VGGGSSTPGWSFTSRYSSPMLTARAAGDNAVLIELDPDITPEALHAASSAAAGLPFVLRATPGRSSVYVVFRSNTPGDALTGVTRAIENAAAAGVAGGIHRIRVSFHESCSPDLPLLLEASAITRENFLAAIAKTKFRARFLGFRPGFAYLDGVPPAWRLPRRSVTRPAVPAGSFAVAGDMAAFYPATSPGGWNLLGRSNAPFWDPARPRPNLFAPGDEIQIDPTVEILSFPHPQRTASAAPDGEAIAEVVQPGQHTLIVGPAHEERAASGLSPGGPFDAEAAKAANHATGNPESAAVLECAIVGPVLRFTGGAILSWYGAEIDASVNGRTVRDQRQFAIEGGNVLTVGRLRGGSRGVLAMRGGFGETADPFTAAPSAILRGEFLTRAGKDTHVPRIVTFSRPAAREIAAVAGPHPVPDEVLELVAARVWRVTDQLDRSGVRLVSEGEVPRLEASLPSCGMQFGTVQWHPGGELVAMGPDHPVTGGYLQVMTVHTAERWKLAQLAPGDGVRWVVERSSGRQVVKSSGGS
jgi:KipI family sensor histidine kinase inhibitor